MAEVNDVRQLLARCQRQDRAAFADLFEHYHPRVFRSAYLITRREDAADDITQLVFVELFSAFRTYDLARPFLPWLYRIVHNVSMDYLKRDRRGNGTLPLLDPDTALGPDPDPGPPEQAEQAELRQTIWDALDRLPPHQRAVLVLRYYAGLNEAEMAMSLGIRPGTVKSRLHRAQHALAGVLSADESYASHNHPHPAPDGTLPATNPPGQWGGGDRA